MVPDENYIAFYVVAVLHTPVLPVPPVCSPYFLEMAQREPYVIRKRDGGVENTAGSPCFYSERYRGAGKERRKLDSCKSKKLAGKKRGEETVNDVFLKIKHETKIAVDDYARELFGWYIDRVKREGAAISKKSFSTIIFEWFGAYVKFRDLSSFRTIQLSILHCA